MSGAVPAWLLGLAALLAAAGWLAFWVQCRRERRTLERLEQMLDQALAGTFAETDFDESLLSAVESRMAQYLAANARAARQLAQQRDQVHTLIGDISHQTKTPLANLLLYAQLLAEQPLSPQGAQCLSALTRQTEKLEFLIGSLVKASRLEAGIFVFHPTPTPVEPLLRRTAQALAPKAQAKGVALALEPCALTALCDGKWAAEALENLVDNAIKYTPAGGRVTLRAEDYPLFCRIDVADTGMGIAEAEQSRIFGRFYRSPAVAELPGVGLGLYLARQIAAGQGGYLRVRSAPGQGSVFSLFLPRPQEGRSAALLTQRSPWQNV